MRRSYLAAAGALVALAAFLVWWLGRGHDPAAQAPARAAQAVESDSLARTSAPELAPPPADSSHPDRGPAAEMVVPPAPPKEPPPYPPGSQPLTEGSDPSLSAKEDDPIDSDHPGALHAVFGARKDVVHPPDPLVLDLEVDDARGKRVAIHGAYARFRSERSTADGPWFRAEFADDGSGADRAANDLRYTCTFTPSSAERDALVGFRLFVEVGFDAPDGLGPRVYGASIMYTDVPHGHLNGTFTEAVEGGSLVVGAGVTIDRPGRFKAIASLYDASGQQALVFAQNSVQLDAGERSIPLTFFGKILHDDAIDGPYQLRYMMLFEEHPEQGTYLPGVTVDPAYTTKPYKAASFAPAPYVPPVDNSPQVTAQSPSQQGKPPAMFGDADRGRGSLGAPPNSSTAPAQGGATGSSGPSGPTAPTTP